MEDIMLIIGLAVIFVGGFVGILLLVPSRAKRRRKSRRRKLQISYKTVQFYCCTVFLYLRSN